MIWAEFKAFLWKNLRDSRAFVDGIWSKLKRDSQYQLEEVQDWAAHLEYLQSILLEFDDAGAPGESYLIRFFREGLRPSIRAQMEQRGRELDSWTEIVEKAVDAEAQASLQPTSYIKEMDQRCLRGNRPNSTKASTQGNSIRDPRTEESRSKPQEPKASAPQHQAEASEKARKEKKKKDRRRDRERREGSTPATGVNTAQTGEPHQKKKKKHRSDKAPRDTSQIKCYNCQKMGHYATTYSEPKKLLSVSSTSSSVTETNKEVILERVPYIHYPLRFRKDTTGVRALVDSGSEVNAITLAYAAKLDLQVRKTDIRTQKIDGSTLKTFGMVLADFQVEDKLKRARFFQKTFLLADISAEVVLGMPFLTLSNADVQFVEKELT